MGQQLFKVHLNINDNILVNCDTSLSNVDNDDISFFYSYTSSNQNQLNNDQQIINSQTEYIKKIQKSLCLLTELQHWNEIDTEINEILMNDIFISITEQNKKIMEEIKNSLIYKEQLQTILKRQIKKQQEKTKYHSGQLSYIAIQSLTSILLILIKSTEKNDPIIIHQVLTLTNELCYQLPMKCLSSKNSFLFKSLEPLTNYIYELSLNIDSNISKQAIQILLSFAIAKGSFKDILFLLNKLIFNTTDIYNVEGLIIQLNNGLQNTIKKWKKERKKLINKEKTDSDHQEDSNIITEFFSLNYLKSTGLYPNTESIELNNELFTGEYLSSIILSHIDLENEFNLFPKQSKLNSISYEFHPNTFKYLFNIIEQLINKLSLNLNHIIIHNLTIILRLFKNHLKILSDIKSLNHTELTSYTTDDELKKWFNILLKLSSNENFEYINVCKEASKALIYIINIQISSFTDKLSLFYQYIIENKYIILINEFSIELNQNDILLKWIENLYDENENNLTFKILYSFIDFYFNINNNEKYLIEQILFSFQKILFYQLINQCEKKILTNKQFQLSSIITKYINYIFKNYIKIISIDNYLFNSILIGLCLMTKINEIFLYEIIQPIFISILPLLSEYYLQNLNNEYNHFICFLLGKISHILIIGSPLDSLEIKHMNKLNLPIFIGGCITDKNDYLLNSNLAIYSQLKLINDKEDDKDFLMSIYNNTNDGAKLILKLKLFIKDKRLLQKSIEQQANDACASIFAVYIKYYRRINLAKYELKKSDQDKPHNQLLSIYGYANRIQTLFATIKGQGGDCDELFKHIKMKTLFLLTFVKENDLISIIKEDLPSVITDIQSKKGFKLQQQRSRWLKARDVIKVLQNLFRACIRFKKFMLEKKQINEQKNDYESILNETLENFIYGDFSKISTSITNEEIKLEIDELKQCLIRQDQRALIRLITYEFIKIFIQNIFKLKDIKHEQIILIIYLPYLRINDFEWSYFNNIQASNKQFKKDICKNYYSIIKLILLPSLQSSLLIKTIFYLLNLSYQSMDICYLYEYEIIEILFTSLISFIENTNDNIVFNLKLIAYNWFRLFVLKLCENIEIEKLQGLINKILQQQENLIFNKLILNELKNIKQIKEILSNNSQDEKINSLKNLPLNCFYYINEQNLSSISNKYHIDLFINQYLVLILQCTYYSKHVITIYSNIDYLEELLYIYHHSQSNITRLLAIKLFSYLIPYIPNDIDGISKKILENFFIEILNTIYENNNSKEIQSELILMYRIIMSTKTFWQILTTEILFHYLKLYLNIDTIKNEKINKLLSTLDILGGYIEPYRLGSIVKIKSTKEINDEFLLGLIIEINSDISYIIQYFQTNQIKSISKDKIEIENNILSPNFLSLPISIDLILDLLGNFIQIDDTLINESLLLLQIKRRCISILYHILNNKKLIEIFMEKSYASTLAKLSISNSLEKISEQLPDLQIINKQHLEQYCLNLDIENNDSLYTIWDNNDINSNQLILDTLSISALKYNGWKPYLSESEIELFKKGRIGNDEINIVPMPLNAANEDVIQECGIKHKFHGKIVPNQNNTQTDFPSFIINNLQLNEGKWYYCVRLPVAGLVQIGWATNGFSPSGNAGVGDDEYSWSYDGSRAVLFNNDGYYKQFNDLHWKANDICGCGIEINGNNTNIKYWLNGNFLGTAFKHNSIIPLSDDIKCNLLPNGSNTTFFPSISIQVEIDSPIYCELIFSPEDMNDCPLPDGYKPLLLPKIIHTENSIVDYPFSAYLVGNNEKDFFVVSQPFSSLNILRDFINEYHIETTFNIDNNYLILSDKSNGFILPIDNDKMLSLTISFNFEILSQNKQDEILLFKFNSTEIKWNKPDYKSHCIIIFLSKKRQIKIYMNNQCQIFTDAFQYETIKKFYLNILPKISVGIQNLAIWKYPLSEGHIHRLFNYGLFYIAIDYQQLKEYRKQVNTISFLKNQKFFTNKLLIPFNEIFTENIWEEKKNELIHFKSNNNEDYSIVELYGNKTYLILDKSIQQWIEYTIILNISIHQLPLINEKLTLIILNSISNIYISHEGKLCLEINKIINESNSIILQNEFFYLFISVQEDSIQIYINNRLEIDIKIHDHQLEIISNRIDLFKENDLTKNTTNENTLRLSFKSITYLNDLISIDQIQSSILIQPPLEIFQSNLIAMGYKKTWIQSILKQNEINNISTLHQILYEQKDDLIKNDLINERKHYLTILSRLNPSIDFNLLKNLINSSKFDTNEQIIDLTQHIFKYLIPSSSSNLSINNTELKINFHTNWFSETIQDFNIHQNLNEWFQDITSNKKDDNIIYQLFDINQKLIKNIPNSIEYSHQNLTSKQLLKCRFNCEYSLITIYARYTILNMIKIWSTYDQLTLFPLEKFGNYKFLITLLKLLNNTEFENNHQIYLLINSILKNEIKQILENHTSLLYHLQQYIIIESIQYLFKPSYLLKEISHEKQLGNLNFILKILKIYMELIIDKSLIQQQEDIDKIISILFPITLINLIFHLFLLIPIHQSKIFLLHLLTTLVQTSKTINLNNQMQEFFIQLLIELSSDTITINDQIKKRFQVALINLIFVLLIKQKEQKINNNQIEEIKSKLPKEIQNLFILNDLIITLNDQTKQTLLPDIFLENFNISNNNLKLNQDDFKKSNIYFNDIADQELIKFINNNELIYNSFIKFYENLPKESEPNPNFYKSYTLLSNIPANYIQIRIKFFYILNKFIEKNLSMIDLSLPQGQNILTDQIRTINHYLLSSTKYELLDESLSETETGYDSNWNIVKFDTIKASTNIEKNENTMFYQAYQQLHSNAHIIFRRTNSQIWNAQYLDMHSTDYGGPYRDSITRICFDICSTRLSLFILCPNGRMNTGLNRDCWIPNVYSPNKSILNIIQKQYQFIGQLFGLAIRKKHYLNIKFPNLFWKKLLNENLTIEDIETIDIQSFTIINEMEKYFEQINLIDTDNNNINSIFSNLMNELRFDVVSSSGKTYELIPSGTDIPITIKNFKYYCSCYKQYRLNEFNRQIDLIRQGLCSIVPFYYLSLFTSYELEEAICGKNQIDIELLKRNTSYEDGYTKDSTVIQYFWTVLSEMFDDDQKKLFLIFVWGRSTLPMQDNDFKDEFIISKFDDYEGEPDTMLPRSHTCTFTIDLPPYSSTEIMYERLNYAMTYCSSIDADGIMNDAPNAGDSSSDNSSDDS